jgi:hypothetical protein
MLARYAADEQETRNCTCSSTRCRANHEARLTAVRAFGLAHRGKARWSVGCMGLKLSAIDAMKSSSAGGQRRSDIGSMHPGNMEI